MTDAISNASVASATSGVTQNTASGTGGLSEASDLADYDDFLTLLTTQLRNQDPLNPQDSTEFVEQIATFTGVEQQISTNAKLDQLIAAQTGEALTDLAAWIGKTVTAANAGFRFDGESLSIDVPADASATVASVTVRDLEGREVASLPADPAGGTVTWDGSQPDGSQAPSGLYRVDFVYGRETADGPENWVRAAEGTGTVVEARLQDGLGELVLDTGAVVSPASVSSLATAAVASDDD